MRRLLIALGIAGLLGLAVAAGFAAFLAAARGGPAPDAPPAEAIIVLTGGAERVETALRLLDAGAAPILLVSGAHPALTVPELARVHGRAPGSLAGRVVLGHAAATTIGNAAEAAAFAQARGIRSVRLVTAAYHMPRAMLEFRRALPGVALHPHPVRPASFAHLPRARRWALLFGEFVKYGTAAAGLTRYLPARESARR
ncbi:YdcF family protein [Falsiroseomonas sp.]|uniref:YdcF family protein n=1 Tax=Falsiroseomonas sp. TaxID=2870721 RepID=UPI003F725D1F